MGEIGRRRFLGGAALVASAAGCRPLRDPYSVDKPAVPLPAGLRPGTEQRVLSTCGLCPAGCGIRVRVVDGRAVKVDGNPRSPINRGHLCARGQAALELLYHPDRVRGPVRRTGARGEGRWTSLGWDEAIGELSRALAPLRAAGEPHALVLVDGEERDTTHALWTRFLGAFGSPNHFGHGATGGGAMRRAMAAATGASGLPGYDFENARLVLLVGTGALEASPQAMALAAAMARISRPRLACAWPRLPLSAALVDDWLPLAPGGQAAFLLALAHVLLRDGLADESRLTSARGFAGLRNRIIADFAPEKLETQTGLPGARVEQLARELAILRPSVVAIDEATADDAAACGTVLVNGLLGSLDEKGGMIRDEGWGSRSGPRPPGAPRGAAPLDGRPRGAGVEHSRLLALPDAILADEPYPVKALLLYYSNPAFSKPGGACWRRALAKVPLVVSFSPLLDESARFADWVLPDATFLERWDVVAPGRGSDVLSLRQPVVRPVENTMPTGEVILRLAAALAGEVGAALPWSSYPDAVAARIRERTGGADVMASLEHDGVWVGPSAGAPFAGTSGRPPIRDVGAALPRDAKVDESSAAFPFTLLPFRGPGHAEGGARHLAWLVELPLGPGDPGQPMVEMSPADAQALRILAGERVVLESPAGRLAARVRVHDGIRPGVLGLPLGGGPWPPAAEDASPMQLLADSQDPRTGQWQATATRARVRKQG